MAWRIHRDSEGNVDWQKRIDREPLKTIASLAAALATEKIDEMVPEGLAGPKSEYKTHDLPLLHTRLRVRCTRLLAQGILTQNITPIRGNLDVIAAYFDEREKNQALRNNELLERIISAPKEHTQETQIENSPNPEMLEYIRSNTPAPLPVDDTPLFAPWVRRYPHSKVNDSLEIRLMMAIGDIEIIPAQAVRWMAETNEGENILPGALLNYLNPPDHGRPIDTPKNTSSAQGGSRPESDKITATQEACEVVAVSIMEGYHLDTNGKIGIDEFVEFVESSMKANGLASMYQSTAAKSFFKEAKQLTPVRRRRGEKK